MKLPLSTDKIIEARACALAHAVNIVQCSGGELKAADVITEANRLYAFLCDDGAPAGR